MLARRLAAVATAVAALAGGALAASGPAAAGTAEIHGRLTLDGKPVDTDVSAWTASGSYLSGSRPDAAGGYRLPMPAAGTRYYVVANLDQPFWEPKTLLGQDVLGSYVGAAGTSSPAWQVIAPAVAGGSDRTMDVVLRHSTPVSGTSPGVAGRTVLLQTLGGTTTAESRADDAGTFVFHVAPGRYRLALDGDGMHLPYRGAPFRVVDGVATTTTVAPLVGGTVAGRITFRGEPVSGIPIRLHGAAGNRTDRTDTSGRYRFRGLPSGDYSLGTGSATSSVTRYVSRLRVVDVRPGSTVTVDQHLRLGGELSARLPAATPRRAVVWLLRRGSTSGPVVRAGRLGAAGGWKDSIRAFGLAPGRYVLQAQRLGAGSYAQRTVTLSSGSALSLGPLRPARRTVTLSGSAAPFSSILVVSSGISTVQSTRATAAGRYRVTGIMRGRYSIAVDDWNHATRTIRTTITGDRRIALHRGHAYGDLGQLTAAVLVNGLPLRRGWVQFASGRRTGIDDGSLLIGARPGPRTIVDVHDDRRFPPGTPYYLTWPSASRDYDFRPGVSTDLGRVDLLVDGG